MWYSKRSAIKSYFKKLSVHLKRKYGKHKHYSFEQVQNSIKELGLNANYIDYALAMYISKNEYRNQIKNNSDYYDLYREEISSKYFNGDSKFNIHDILRFAEDSSNLHMPQNFEDDIDENDNIY
ncbi:MAG: hypothetical protein HND52_18860 [Ignavibacteriae bacterium]|nr:hypothetical protein [Ignavibacteriota bacterium]NOH00027.1 hypothetical protein [Ignavibacteriota bacterium]